MDQSTQMGFFGRGYRNRQGRNNGGSCGPGGFCVCTACGHKEPHTRGVKCTTLKCPECGHVMIREELLERKAK